MSTWLITHKIIDKIKFRLDIKMFIIINLYGKNLILGKARLDISRWIHVNGIIESKLTSR